MKFDEILELVKAGKKVPNEDWLKLTKEGKEQISKVRKDLKFKNDWKWYAISEEIAKDLASLPYNVMAGVGFVESAKMFNPSNNLVVPIQSNPKLFEESVCTIDYVNTPGYAEERTSGINMAATLLYTAVRRANSGARNYEAADLMIYILAMREIYAEVSECRRVLGLAGLYDIENHYLPDMLLTAAGIDSVDLRQNLANYRGRLNLLIAKINAFAVPDYFSAFNRSAYIAETVYADSESIRGQFYMFRRAYYYVFSATASSAGSTLVSKAVPTVTRKDVVVTETFATKLSRLEEMLNALFLDDDMNTMSGDILKAFTASHMYSVTEVPTNFILQPIKDEDILAQIENSHSIYSWGVGLNGEGEEFINDLDVTQINQLIKFTPTIAITVDEDEIKYVNLAKYYFNSHKDNPDFKDNLEWSRLISLVPYGNNSVAAGLKVQCVGLELVLNYRLFNYQANPATEVVSVVTSIFGNEINVSVTTSGANISVNLLALLARLEQFDWHPMVYVVMYNLASLNVKVAGDLKKFTVIDDIAVTPLHDAAVTSCFWSNDLYNITKSV